MRQRIRHLGDLGSLRDALEQDRIDAERREAEARAAAVRIEREADLFRRTVGDVEPLKKAAARVEHVLPKPAPIARHRERDEAEALRESLSDTFDPELLDTDEQLSWARSGIARDIPRKLRTGRWVVQAEIDLHGARVDEARAWLADFLHDAVKRQLRCVRIVHGKGHGSIGRQPVLKGKVKRWLMQKDEVLAWCQPREHDGGGGALIVLLRPS